jgi:protocatechuate 3,4-dioxygenase beta subunit
VDLWHAGPTGAFDPKTMVFRGYQLTDALGGFQFETLAPGATAGKPAYLGVHVVVPAKADFWTVLFFPDDARNEADRRFRPELLVKLVSTKPSRRAHFDVLLDL